MCSSITRLLVDMPRPYRQARSVLVVVVALGRWFESQHHGTPLQWLEGEG